VESFFRQVFDIYKPDMFLEGSNMLVAENAELTELPRYDGDPDELYQDFLPEDILNRPAGKP
jgi:hypothetical protein